MLHINFQAGTLRPAPRKNRPNRNETWYPVWCDCCGAAYELRKPDYNRRQSCRYCAYHTRRMVNRAWSEIMVQGWLDEAGIVYQPEQVFVTKGRVFVVDFVIGDVAVEINGWGHKLFDRKQRDKALSDCWNGSQVVFIETSDLRERPAYARDVLMSVFAQ